MKKIISILFATCLAVFGLFGLTACGSDSETTSQQLATPTVTLVGNTASWEENTKAEKFEISLSGSLSYVENTITSKVLEDGQTLKVRAIGDGTNYTTSGWSNTVTYSASGTQQPDNPSPNPDSPSQEPKYLGIFASTNEPQQSDGLPNDLQQQSLYSATLNLTAQPRTFQQLLQEQ